MAQNDAVTKALSGAKAALGHANATFPSPKLANPAKPMTPAAAPKPASLGTELQVKKDNVDQYVKALPKMHNGGPIMTDGAYQLKAGEHVLTAPEAAKARKHAMMAVGMKSLAQTMPKSAGQPTKTDVAHKAPEKKMTSGIKVRPEKNQAAKIVDKTKK